MAVLYEQNAEAGTVNTGVSTDTFNYTEDGQTPYSRPFCRDDTPVPNAGHTKYFRTDFPGYEGTSTATGLNSLTDANAAGTGTGTISSSGAAVTGSGTAFLTELHIGDAITADGETRTVLSIHSDTSLDVASAWTAPLSGDTFIYAWATNKWGTAQAPDEAYQLIDSAGTSHNIASNTGTVLTLSSGLTPAAGAYQIVGHHGTYWTHSVTQINLSHGTTYYFGAFFRIDRINSRDVWHDSNSPDSYDKLLEVDGGIRLIHMFGWPLDLYTAADAAACDGKFTACLYISCVGCDQTNSGGSAGCCAEKYQNFSPYSSANPYLMDYDKWYACVIEFNPSTDQNTNDGQIKYYINGTQVFQFDGVTQANGAPYIDSIRFGSTAAQPDYDAPAHKKKFDQIMLTSDLQSIIDAGLMADPEAIVQPQQSSGQPFNRRFWGIPGHVGYNNGVAFI